MASKRQQRQEFLNRHPEFRGYVQAGDGAMIRRWLDAHPNAAGKWYDMGGQGRPPATAPAAPAPAPAPSAPAPAAPVTPPAPPEDPFSAAERNVAAAVTNLFNTYGLGDALASEIIKWA
jgi:hypothetical protein